MTAFLFSGFFKQNNKAQFNEKTELRKQEVEFILWHLLSLS